MANTEYTSPLPTSHDTIGQSTLVTPIFMPSSPPQHHSSPPTESTMRAESPAAEEENNNQDRDEDHAHHSENEVQNLSRPSTPGSPTGSDLDARLADYSLDFNRFPSQFSAGAKPLPQLKDDADDKLSDVGGPEDFTANLEKYLMGQDEGAADINKTQGNEAVAEIGSASQQYPSKTQQPAAEEEAESGEYSEFGPPVDMSTPSHLLYRTSAFAKDSTHLEDIEEDTADNENPATPSIRKQSTSSSKDVEDEKADLRQRVAELEQTVRDRDEQLQRNRSRVLEAVSAGEQIRHLQAELQRRNSLLNEMQHDDRGRLSQMASPGGHDLSGLQHQIRDMQQELQNRNSQSSLDAERLETIAHLRQQLSLSQQQLKKRDAALDETVAKLKEVTQAKETQLRDKNSEIDGLKAQTDDHALENERLEIKLERARSEHQALEEQNRPLEEKNSTLEADLSRARSQVTAQENALKAVAADMPMGGHNTYTEILDLIKELGPPNAPVTPETSLRGKPSEGQDAQQLRQEITLLQQELQETSAVQKAADAEARRLRDQATETQHLIQSIESENSRLTKRVDDLTASLHQSQHELTRTREEHAECLETIARLQEAKAIEPPSPPLSPPKAHGAANSEQSQSPSVMAESHQGQIRSLQTAHATAISTLRSSHAESIRKMRNTLQAAEQREAELRSELTNLRSPSTTQESQQRKTLQSEIKRLEAIITAKDETAAAVDQRIAMSVDNREREWARRVKMLLKERDHLGKALMQAWGEKELGSGSGVLADGKENQDGKQGQAYRYKYAQKHKIRSIEPTA